MFSSLCRLFVFVLLILMLCSWTVELRCLFICIYCFILNFYSLFIIIIISSSLTQCFNAVDIQKIMTIFYLFSRKNEKKMKLVIYFTLYMSRLLSRSFSRAVQILSIKILFDGIQTITNNGFFAWKRGATVAS